MLFGLLFGLLPLVKISGPPPSGASLMEFSNIPIWSIQRILGHENRATTEIYLHSVGNSEIKAIQEYEHAKQKSHIDSHAKEKM